jgi:type IV secretion system protein TrbE
MIFDELRIERLPPEPKYSTPELLYYSHLVADGVIRLKDDASLMRTFRVRGPDLKSASDEERLALRHNGNRALTRLDDGWMVQTDLVRYPTEDYAAGGAFPDPVTRLIEHQREAQYRRQGAHFESAIYFTITYRPPGKGANFGRSLFFRDRMSAEDRNLQHFLTTTDTLTHDLSAQLQLDPLGSAALMSFVESEIIGEQVRMRAPQQFNYLDLWLGRHFLTKGTKPTIAGRHLRVVVPMGLPLESHAEVCEFLNELPFAYRYSIRGIMLGTHNARKIIGKRRTKHHNKRLRPWAFIKETTGAAANPNYINEHADKMAQDANVADAEVESNQVRGLYLTMAVVLIGENRGAIEDQAEYVRKTFSHRDFLARIETFNTIEAWRGTLAGDGWSNVRKMPVNSMNLSDLMPMTSLWTGDIYNPNPMYPPKTPPLFYATTTGQTPFRFHPHVSDVGHGVIIGPVGSGKSTLAAFIMAQAFRVPNMQVFAFDKGYSSFILTKACGGQHWDLGNDVINAAPLINIDQEVEREWAHGYVSNLIRIALTRDLTAREDDDVWQALVLLSGRPRHYRTMTALQTHVQNHDLKAALARYTLKGPMGRYLDANEDALLDARFVTFELETLRSSPAMVPVLLYLFHRVEQRLDGRPTLIIVDEAALLALLNNDMFGTKLEEWYRDNRRKNAAVWLCTQSLEDLRRSQYRSIILESATTKIFLPNPEARTENIAEIYRDFGLSSRQIEIIADECVAKRDYYLVSTRGRRVFAPDLDPVTLSFVGASSKDDLRRTRELIAEYGESWPMEWLRERGLPDAARQLESTANQSTEIPQHFKSYQVQAS